MSVNKLIVICKHVKGHLLIWFSKSEELKHTFFVCRKYGGSFCPCSPGCMEGREKGRAGGGGEGEGEGSSGRGGGEGEGEGSSGRGGGEGEGEESSGRGGGEEEVVGGGRGEGVVRTNRTSGRLDTGCRA